MTVHKIKKVTELNADNSVYRLQGFYGQAAASSISSIDFQMAYEIWVSGGYISVKDGNWGDKLTIQIVDVNNLLGYGTNIVLRQFVENMCVVTDQQYQCNIDISYVALIPAGLYVRVVYDNTGIDPVDFAVNIYSHLPVG
jgi:hypothetical protein